MDPITGISLAAAVVQLVDCGIRATKTCIELYERGSSNAYDSADAAAIHLAALTISLKESLDLANGEPTHSLSKDEQDLRDMAQKCQHCSNKLHGELSKLQPRTQKSTREAIKKTLRSMLKHSKIKKMQDELEGYRALLESSLLYRLCKRFDAESLQSRESFSQLSSDVQHVVQSLANGHTSLAALIISEHDQTRQHVTSGLEDLKQLHIDDRRYQEVKDSLFYPDIHTRREQIERQFDGIEDSYHWIFNDPSEPDIDEVRAIYRHQPHWDSFVDWLKCGGGVYWINGKAGSGKSTLMSFICDHEDTKNCLEQWKGTNQLLTPTFFFWISGTELQRSFDGLLRSLIFQVLNECPELVICFKNEPLYTWTDKRLSIALDTLLAQTIIPTSTCLFIDGLDEFEGNYRPILETIARLSNRTCCKICVSSRPLHAFEKAFAGKLGLKLQDLTYKSICNYATSRLSPHIEEQFRPNTSRYRKALHMVDTIVERAEGVFLWAVIAVRNLESGFNDLVDIGELERDLESLPDDLEKLYSHILTQIKPAYQKDAIRFLLLTIYEKDFTEEHTLDLYRLYFITEQHVSGDLALEPARVGQEELIAACHRIERRIRSHTRGLLDISSAEEVDEIYGGKDFNTPVLLMKVRIFHRTVKDFFLHNISAKPLLKAAGEECHLRLSIARGTLCQLEHLSQRTEEYVLKEDILPHYDLMNSAMGQIARVEKLVGAAQTTLMRSLDNYALMPKHVTISAYYHGRYEATSPYMLRGPTSADVDMVAIAAANGMTYYVCEMLGLPKAGRLQRHVQLTRHMEPYHSDDEFVPAIVSDVPVNVNINYSLYRQEAQQFLRQEAHVKLPYQACGTSREDGLLETYLLACIKLPLRCDLLERLSLLSKLLDAGANPMMPIRPHTDMRLAFDVEHRFWDHWLAFLEILDISNTDFRLGLVAQQVFHADPRVCFEDIYNMTKVLLNRGAQLHHKLRWSIPVRLCGSRLDIMIVYDAAFWLKIYFSGFAEFQSFFTALDPLGKKQWCYITYISLRASKNREKNHVYPTEEECEMLFSLLDSWQPSRGNADCEKLELATREVFKKYRPEVNVDDKSDLSGSESDDSESEDSSLYASDEPDLKTRLLPI